MPTIIQVLEQGRKTLTKAGITTASLDSQILLECVTDKDRLELLAHSEQALSPVQARQYLALLKRRAHQEPIAYISGHKEFYGLDLTVTPAVMIPRPETEAIVETALDLNKKHRLSLLDVGTGSGAIAIALAKAKPDWKVTATDISPLALRVAAKNASHHRVRIRFIRSSLLEKIGGKFQIVTANLPYVKTGGELSLGARFEPRLALDGGTDGLDHYRRFFEHVGRVLAPNASVIIESDPWQQPALIDLAYKHRLSLFKQAKFVLAFTNP